MLDAPRRTARPRPCASRISFDRTAARRASSVEPPSSAACTRSSDSDHTEASRISLTCEDTTSNPESTVCSTGGDIAANVMIQC
jgi:hypothetical protein